jgi:hypothetical protein
MDREEGGRLFREAWIAGIHAHYPGAPKPGYVAPWEEMGEWEQRAAIATYEQVRQFVLLTNGRTQKLSREQKGRFVCLCWIGQIYRYFEAPKESYVADWEQLPAWQRETDADIFETIERVVHQEMTSAA